MKKSSEKGITLIALVVTIVILLILAGISIAMLTGENGVITQSRNAKEATEQAKVEELVSVALGSVISKNNGSTAGITPKMIADQINEDEKRLDVYAENETTFPTNIIFPKENRKAEVKLNVVDIADDSIYNTDINDEDIAPVDLFDYEIINDGSTGSLTISNLPTKTVKITRIKPEFCNGLGYNPDTENWEYTNTNYDILYNGSKIDDTLIVPYQVDGKYVPNGIEGELYTVTEACIYVFGRKDSSELPNVKKIVFPNTITKITGSVSSGNKTVEEIELSKNIKSIDEEAFARCDALTNITIPDGVTSIGKYAFFYCDKLTNVVVPDSVTSIGYRAFIVTPFYNNLPDGEIYLGKVYYQYKGSPEEKIDIKIKDGTKSIVDYAFAGCEKITSIEIPDGLINIGKGAFNGCDGLTNMIIPSSVTYIGNEVLEACFNVTSIQISEKNSKYDSRDNCNAIIETSTNKLIQGCSTTVIVNGITSIEYSAFRRCYNLTNITIPEGVTSIGEYAFEDCYGLEGINIPATLTNININTFNDCNGLMSIQVSENNSKYDSRNGCNAIIETNTNKLIRGCNTTVIPNSVVTIGEHAFEGCYKLTSLIIPSGITDIGYKAFNGCSDLTSITIPSNITKIEYYAFSSCNSLKTVNYTGTKEEWSKISIGYGNGNLENATINYNYTGE